jgi:hypothetical protein
VRAAGWQQEAIVRGRGWHSCRRRRANTNAWIDKVRWGKPLRPRRSNPGKANGATAKTRPQDCQVDALFANRDDGSNFLVLWRQLPCHCLLVSIPQRCNPESFGTMSLHPGGGSVETFSDVRKRSSASVGRLAVAHRMAAGEAGRGVPGPPSSADQVLQPASQQRTRQPRSALAGWWFGDSPVAGARYGNQT